MDAEALSIEYDVAYQHGGKPNGIEHRHRGMRKRPSLAKKRNKPVLTSLTSTYSLVMVFSTSPKDINLSIDDRSRRLGLRKPVSAEPHAHQPLNQKT